MKLCLHEYGKWSKAFGQSVSSETSMKQQSKICSKCGKIVVRFIFFSTYTHSETINRALEENVIRRHQPRRRADRSAYLGKRGESMSDMTDHECDAYDEMLSKKPSLTEMAQYIVKQTGGCWHELGV